MLSDYNTLIISQNLIIEENISDDVVISGNIQLLQRLVDNLLLNAVKFAEGKIKLSLENKEHKVRFSISDDGPVNDYDAWCYSQYEKFQAAIEWVRGR